MSHPWLPTDCKTHHIITNSPVQPQVLSTLDLSAPVLADATAQTRKPAR